jgi:outer membrane protein assembly factor BamB
VSPPIELVPVANRADAAQGLKDCTTHGPSCPVSSPPAYDPASGRIVLSFWAPGAPGARLVGMRYDAGNKTLAVDWHAPVGQGPISMPVIGAGAVYQLDRSGTLTAYRLNDGFALWSTPTGRSKTAVLALNPNGTVVLGSSDTTPEPQLGAPPTGDIGEADRGGLAAYTAKGQLWRRDDVRCLSPVTITGENTGLVLAMSASGKGSAIVRFEASTGKTISITELPDIAPATSPGISVSSGGELVFAVGGQLVALDGK